MDEDQVARLMMANGFAEARRTTKVVEFVSLKNRKVVYFERKNGMPTSVKLVIHPAESLRTFLGIPDIETDPAALVHHHSNMTAFPRKRNTGKDLIPYGQPLRILGYSALPKFASAFHSL